MKKFTLCLCGILLLCSQWTTAQENPWTANRPDGHAPISVMGDHYHQKGEWMFSYRIMAMGMEGVRSGTQDTNSSSVHQNYMVTPKKMNMQMHMVGIMYAYSDRLTLMMMGNYTALSMDLVSRMNAAFTTESKGMGDLSLTGLIKLYNQSRKSIHLNMGISIPTGSIDQKDDTPMMTNAPLAYPMQLGSGTWDPVMGLTYLGQSSLLSWGWQANYKVRTGKNDNSYRLGNTFEALGWGAVKLSQRWSFATQLKYINRWEIKGSYPALNPMMMPLFDAKNSGKDQLNLGLSTNWYFPEGSLKNFRLGASFEIPVVQNLRGIQMKTKSLLTFGIQYSFKAKKEEE
jgi:hypothetical protein